MQGIYLVCDGCQRRNIEHDTETSWEHVIRRYTAEGYPDIRADLCGACFKREEEQRKESPFFRRLRFETGHVFRHRVDEGR